MKLVDTSSWVHQIRRRGDPAVRARVELLLRTGEAAWCPIVRLELWAGVGSEADRKLLRAYQQRLPELAMTDKVWQKACDLADRCRRAGRTAPPHDIAIVACASHHGVEIEHDDPHFDLLSMVQSLEASPSREAP
jgi:predicted nucleic acid-binding protein